MQRMLKVLGDELVFSGLGGCPDRRGMQPARRIDGRARTMYIYSVHLRAASALATSILCSSGTQHDSVRYTHLVCNCEDDP